MHGRRFPGAPGAYWIRAPWRLGRERSGPGRPPRATGHPRARHIHGLHSARLMRLLCISDIHGHADALSAVLAATDARGFSRLLVAGDLCFPGPAPLETW